MTKISVLVCHLFIFISCQGLKISSKLNIDGESGSDSDVSNSDREETGNEDVTGFDEGSQSKNVEAKIPLLLSKKKDGYEIKIPLAIEREVTTEANGKIAFFTGFDLFERRSTTVTERTTPRTVPIVKGSLSHIKPDFLVPIPREPTTTGSPGKESYTFEMFWPDRGLHDQKNDIEGLKPPTPVHNQWILNTTPFLSFPRNTTSRPSPAPTLNMNKIGKPTLWQVLESGSWKPRDPSFWYKNPGGYWVVRKPGWTDFGHNYQNNYPNYYTPNDGSSIPHSVAWTTYHQGQGGRPPPRGRWISCPPYEVNDVRSSGRNIFSGCPQYPPGKPSDVEIINVTPISNIDDKTSFRDFVEKPGTTSEEPKLGQ